MSTSDLVLTHRNYPLVTMAIPTFNGAPLLRVTDPNLNLVATVGADWWRGRAFSCGPQQQSGHRRQQLG
jgi:hypothetical protein